MKISDLKRPTLRDRNMLEEQLAAEIALGVLKSLDTAIENQHEVALEYGAQLLFNNIRSKIALQKNLPPQIACYLFFDRDQTIRFQAISENFYSLPEDYQEAFLEETSATLELIKEYPYYRADNGYEERYILEKIRNSAIRKNDDKLTARLTAIKFVVRPIECAPSKNLEELKKFPETVKVCYDMQLKENSQRKIYTRELALVHSDESIRFQAIQELIACSATELRKQFRQFSETAAEEVIDYRHRYRKGDVKKVAYLAVADDPSLRIRTFLVNNIRHAEVLQIIADRYKLINPDLAEIAKKRGERIKRRTEYTMNYQKNHQKKRADS